MNARRACLERKATIILHARGVLCLRRSTCSKHPHTHLKPIKLRSLQRVEAHTSLGLGACGLSHTLKSKRVECPVLQCLVIGCTKIEAAGQASSQGLRNAMQ